MALLPKVNITWKRMHMLASVKWLLLMEIVMKLLLIIMIMIFQYKDNGQEFIQKVLFHYFKELIMKYHLMMN
jgi:hypothetical protein